MSEIILSRRHIILIILFTAFYLYLSDKFRSKEFKENMKTYVQNGNNNTAHTILDSLETASNMLAGVTSFTSVAIIDKLPVSKMIFQKFFLI